MSIRYLYKTLRTSALQALFRLYDIFSKYRQPFTKAPSIRFLTLQGLYTFWIFLFVHRTPKLSQKVLRNLLTEAVYLAGTFLKDTSQGPEHTPSIFSPRFLTNDHYAFATSLRFWKRSITTRRGAARQIDEYVPAIIPTMRVSAKFFVGSGPIK